MTPAQFVELPLEERNDVYARRLVVKDGYVLIEEGYDEDVLNPEIAQGIILRQEHFMGADAVGR